MKITDTHSGQGIVPGGMSRRKAWLLLIICMCMTTLPFLGLTDFNTKGEPREAVVAYSILSQDDWILPTNNGGEIPYKPPFFHWCIAAASLLNGGVVNEYTSRLPSALALIAMCASVFAFFARRRSTAIGLLTAVVTFTAFEIYRAGMNCRVDMMLTALSVGAMLLLYRWWERGMHGLPWWAILLMSCATLTKGPVGIIIPCVSAGIFMLIRGVHFWPIFIRLVLSGFLSLILPLCWYVAAYGRGGEEFLALVLEENFGRMSGTMAYESHLNPWYYNIVTLVAGFLPWTIAALTALFIIKWKAAATGLRRDVPSLWHTFRTWIGSLEPVTLFSLVCAATVFIFYCIPASKRSVYLMPMYPFTAYFLALMLGWMAQRKRGTVLGLGDGLAALGTLMFILFVVIKCGWVGASVFGHGRHAAANAAMLSGLRHASGFLTWIWALIPVAAAAVWWGYTRKRVTGYAVPLAAGGILFCLYIAFSGVYQPALLNTKSKKAMAAEILKAYPDAPSQIYEFIAAAEEAAGNPMHFFELDYYMGDPVRNFRREDPEEGYLLIEPGDAEMWLPRFEKEGYRFTLLREPGEAEPKHTPSLYRFTLPDPPEQGPQ